MLHPVKNTSSTLLLNSLPDSHHKKKQKHRVAAEIASDTNVRFLIYRSNQAADHNLDSSSDFY